MANSPKSTEDRGFVDTETLESKVDAVPWMSQEWFEEKVRELKDCFQTLKMKVYMLYLTSLAGLQLDGEMSLKIIEFL